MFNDPPEAVRAMVNYLYTATYPKHGLNGPDLVLFHLDVYIIATTYLVEGLARIAKNSLAQELDNTPEVLPDVTNALRECNFRFRTFPKMRGLYRGIKKWAIGKFEDTYDDNTWKVMAKESPGFIQDVTKEAWRQWERSCTREAAIWLEHFEGPDSTGRVRVDNAECPGGCEYIQDRLILSTKGVAKQECVHCGKLYTSAEWFANSVLSISEYPESETTDDGSDSFDIWGEDAVDYSDGEEDSESD
ncbi:hypothetical protein DBV05_g11626 [Lasiodiplodia theobromae]|uniref:BTB domain-containing protein n=1 Tax=Lasiodiplodia theobromae TaxID=45133 RepID=A0A5N5CWN3_9PEZI|nr:hypothetical protein DBV05_g11626 [Lasiodiplodia theobromae]